MFGFLFLPLAIFWYQVVRVKKKKKWKITRTSLVHFDECMLGIVSRGQL